MLKRISLYVAYLFQHWVLSLLIFHSLCVNECFTARCMFVLTLQELRDPPHDWGAEVQACAWRSMRQLSQRRHHLQWRAVHLGTGRLRATGAWGQHHPAETQAGQSTVRDYVLCLIMQAPLLVSRQSETVCCVWSCRHHCWSVISQRLCIVFYHAGSIAGQSSVRGCVLPFIMQVPTVCGLAFCSSFHDMLLHNNIYLDLLKSV